jgi:hypothetical protein
MNTVFQGERSTATNASILTGVNCARTPPSDDDDDDFDFSSPPLSSSYDSTDILPPATVRAWMEFWDYAGRTSFRAFVAENGCGKEKSLFAFFDNGLVHDGRDLKQAYVDPFLPRLLLGQ